MSKIWHQRPKRKITIWDWRFFDLKIWYTFTRWNYYIQLSSVYCCSILTKKSVFFCIINNNIDRIVYSPIIDVIIIIFYDICHCYEYNRCMWSIVDQSYVLLSMIENLIFFYKWKSTNFFLLSLCDINCYFFSLYTYEFECIRVILIWQLLYITNFRWLSFSKLRLQFPISTKFF